VSEPLKILQIVPSISLVYGGPSQMVKGLSQALASQGVEVTVLTTDSNGDSGQPPLEVPLNQPVFEDGYQIRYFHCSGFRRYKFSLELLRWLWENTTEFDLAHIHALFSPVSTAAATIARYKKLPYILRPLGTLDPADLQKKRRLKQVYAALLERHNLAGASGIHFTSAQEAKISERFGTSSTDIIIPLGVRPPQSVNPLILPDQRGTKTISRENSSSCQVRHQLGISDDLPLLLFMSRIDPKKGLNLLIPALEKLLQEGLRFQLVLAGTNPQDPDYEKQILEQIKASVLAENTTITGFVSGELKQDLLQAADLFVLPSYYENFGIAVAEAMVAGTPVVISDQVHIWEEISNAEAGWVCACEIDNLTLVLQEALQDVEQRKRRGENAQAYALKYYSWEVIAQQMIQTYKQILEVRNKGE
jgi:glycosyltransferase involved in cell wall biosynthesis